MEVFRLDVGSSDKKHVFVVSFSIEFLGFLKFKTLGRGGVATRKTKFLIVFCLWVGGVGV